MTAIDNRTLHEGVNQVGLVLIYDHENEIR